MPPKNSPPDHSLKIEEQLTNSTSPTDRTYKKPPDGDPPPGGFFDLLLQPIKFRGGEKFS